MNCVYTYDPGFRSFIAPLHLIQKLAKRSEKNKSPYFRTDFQMLPQNKDDFGRHISHQSWGFRLE